MANFTLKSSLEYRWNFLVQAFYGPAYIGVMYLLVETAFAKAPILAGWTRAEGILLFSVFQLLYAICYIIFMKGVRHLMWHGVRHGELDLLMTKPVNLQFFATFNKPNFDLLILASILASLFIYQLSGFVPLISLINAASFVLLFLVGIAIAYLAVSLYATASFYITKAEQVIELYDKTTDFAQYPIPLFPSSIQMLFFTLVPTAFFSYIPTAVLLGKISPIWIGVSLLFCIGLFFINQYAWKVGLQHYSSASS